MTETARLSRDAQAFASHPWLEHYPADVSWSAPLPCEPVFAAFDRAVAAHAGRPCLDFLGRHYTYGEIGQLVERAARGFQALGVAPGVRVGLCLPNTPYAVICYYAVLKAGGTVVNYNPLYVEREMRAQVEDSGTEIMVTLDLAQIYPTVAALLGQTPLRQIVVCSLSAALPRVKGLLFPWLRRAELATIPHDHHHQRFADLIDNDGRPEPVTLAPEHDLAVIQYTGGTTGLPKGALLTHANLTANVAQVQRWFPGMKPGAERMVAVLPFFHVFAMTVVMNLGLAAGAELILLPRFNLKQFLDTVQRTRPTLLPGVPTLYKAICSAPGIERYDLSSIRYCLSGGAPLPAEVKQEFEALTGCTLVEGYGLSEASPVVTVNPLTGPGKPGSVGLPLPGTVIEIHSVIEPEQRLAPGELGEVWVRGPQVMPGYWQRPEENAATVVEGALRTGDIGYLDDDGYLFLVDRLKDVILCGGYNVYPRTIEEALYRHPSVAAAVVIGIPDDYRGQAPKAFVQLKDGHPLTPAELSAFLTDHLSRIERPREIEFRESLPTTAVGKLSKKELVAEELAKRQQASAA